jgi:EAL and modified HD-GYP domain-containing signal transduction protein
MSKLISRSPITSGKQVIFAYRLGGLGGVPFETGPLSSLLCQDKGAKKWLLKEQRILLGFAESLCEEATLERSFRDHCIVDLTSDSHEETLHVAQTLKSLGYRIFLALNPDHPLPIHLLEVATYIGVPADSSNLKAVSKALRKFSGKQIARPISNQTDFRLALEADVDFVEGYYFSDPVAHPTSKAINPAYTSIITVMQLAQQNAPIQRIEEALKRDAALSFRLLRYINSAGLGLSCEISSFRHAVTIIGYQNLYRWLSLLLVSAVKDAGCPALMTTAVIRGRLAELLGAGYFEKQDRDNLFIVGVFSMLDIMLGMSMEKLLEQIPLSESIVDALTSLQGNYGPFLELARCCENLSDDSVVQRAHVLMDSLQLTHDHVNRAHMQALGWTEGLGL